MHLLAVKHICSHSHKYQMTNQLIIKAKINKLINKYTNEEANKTIANYSQYTDTCTLTHNTFVSAVRNFSREQQMCENSFTYTYSGEHYLRYVLFWHCF